MKDKLFVWKRPLRRSDLEALGDAAPDGPILGARVEHLVAKEALLADDDRRLLHHSALRGLPRGAGAAGGDRPRALEPLTVEGLAGPRAETARAAYLEALP